MDDRQDERPQPADAAPPLAGEQTAVLIAQCDCEGRYRYVNAAFADRWGLRVEEVLGRHIAEVVGAEAYAAFRPHVEAALAGRPVEFEVTVPYARLGPRVMHATYVPERDAGGAVLGMLAVLTDLTDQRAAEAALRESEARFRQLADNLPAGFIYQITPGPGGERRFSYVSGGVANLLGVTPEEVAADPTLPHRRILPEDRPRVEAAEVVSAQSGRPFDCRFRCHGRDGAVHWLHCRSAPRTLTDGATVWDGLALDVTERVQAEAELRLSEERFRAIMEQAPLSTQLFTPDGWTVAVNRAWEELWGITLEQVADYNVLRDPQLVAKGIMPYLEKGFAGEATAIPAIQYDPNETIPDRTRHQDPRRWVRAFIYPIKDAAGQVREVVLVHEDVSDRKRLEDELRQRADQLAEADRRKDEFLAILGHELRNPLAPLRNALEVLHLTDRGQATARPLLELMGRQVKTLARLTDELLDISRVTRGKIQLRKEPVDLAALLQRAADTTRPPIEQRGHRLTVTPPPEPLRLDADPVRLEQVLTNLLHNAAKYTPPGGQIRLSAGRDGAWAVVAVADTGIGLRPEVRARLFEPFLQADRVPGQVAEGLGVGLALVKGLVELHGGTVAADSAGPGHGSTFTVRLPLAAGAAPAHPAPAPTPARVEGPRRRILVVDDNVDAAESLALLLRLLGHDVHSANDGPAALTAAAEQRPEVVFLDLGMPGMDGFEVARRLRAAGLAPLLVAMTGYGQDEDRRRTRAAGFDHHLTKPAHPRDVEALLAGPVAGA